MIIVLASAVLALTALTSSPAGQTPPPASAEVAQAAPDLDRNPNLAERAWVASVVYRTVKEYFAHWIGLPPDL